MRGSNTLFSDIFQTTAPAPIKRAKGRSASLHDQRNECLVARYYFYSKFHENKLAYNYIITTVASEFWLSPVTVPEIIDDNYESLIRLKKEQPSLRYFKDKWPHLVWAIA